MIVVDGCNRERLRQASALGLTPTIDRLLAEGTEYLDVRTAYPARTVVCFSSMLTGATPAEHGMRSNFAPRLGVRVPSLFDVLESHGRRGRLVGIAHLLDPFGEQHVRTVTSVQPTERLDHSLAAAAREVVEREDPDLLVAAAARGRPARPRPRHAQPRVPRPARGDRPADRRASSSSWTTAGGSTTRR